MENNNAIKNVATNGNNSNVPVSPINSPIVGLTTNNTPNVGGGSTTSGKSIGGNGTGDNGTA